MRYTLLPFVSYKKLTRTPQGRNLLLLLPTLLPFKGHNLRAQRCQSLQILPLKMSQEFQDEAEPPKSSAPPSPFPLALSDFHNESMLLC